MSVAAGALVFIVFIVGIVLTVARTLSRSRGIFVVDSHKMAAPTVQKDSFMTPIRVFQNQHQSCWIDSLLVALFHRRNDFLNTYLLNAQTSTSACQDTNQLHAAIQQNLIGVCKYVRGVAKEGAVSSGNAIVGELRRNLTRLSALKVRQAQQYNETKADSVPGQSTRVTNWMAQDSPTVLWSELMSVFKIPDLVLVAVQHIGYTNVGDTEPAYWSEVETRHSSHTIDIQGHSNHGGEGNIVLSDIIHSATVTSFDAENVWQNKYFKKVELKQYVDAQFLHFHIDRVTSLHSAKTTHFVEAPATIALSGGGRLNLSSFIVHSGNARGGHYVAYLHLKSGWYKYDDMGARLTKVRSTNILEDASVMRCATDFFYVQ